MRQERILIGRVFRNEKVSYKHLVEFNQIEGVVVGKNATLRRFDGNSKRVLQTNWNYKNKILAYIFPIH